MNFSLPESVIIEKILPTEGKLPEYLAKFSSNPTYTNGNEHADAGSYIHYPGLEFVRLRISGEGSTDGEIRVRIKGIPKRKVNPGDLFFHASFPVAFSTTFLAVIDPQVSLFQGELFYSFSPDKVLNLGSVRINTLNEGFITGKADAPLPIVPLKQYYIGSGKGEIPLEIITQGWSLHSASQIDEKESKREGKKKELFSENYRVREVLIHKLQKTLGKGLPLGGITISEALVRACIPFGLLKNLIQEDFLPSLEIRGGYLVPLGRGNGGMNPVLHAVLNRLDSSGIQGLWLNKLDNKEQPALKGLERAGKAVHLGDGWYLTSAHWQLIQEKVLSIEMDNLTYEKVRDLTGLSRKYSKLIRDRVRRLS
jgi:hypothetical protein